MKRLLLFPLLALMMHPAILHALQPKYPASLHIEVIADDGRVFPAYPASSRERAVQRAYLQAEHGQKYGIRVRNNSPQRRGLVIAVDGRNIISGEKSDLQHNERMYILEPWQTATYRGWRTGRDRINRFYFTAAGDSYAAAWQDHSAMGIIAVAAFNPKHRHRHDAKRLSEQEPVAKNSAARQDAAAPGVASEGLAGKERREAGTGFGEEQYSHARVVAFTPERSPRETWFYKYEWRESLCKKAIIDCGVRPFNRFWPQPGSDLGFAPYPPGR